MAVNVVWGLDIGNSAIKVVKMARVPNGCKIVDFDIVDIPVSEDDRDRPARLQAALSNLANNHKFGSDPVFISVTGNICLHREFQLPPGSEDKLNDLVQYEAKQQIPFPLDQVEWGFERYEDPAGVGVALIAVRKNDIQDLLNLTDQCKLNVRGITAGPMALFNFVHYEFTPENTTLILDAGAKGTDFVVMNKRQIYFRSIQIAGREITRVLENKFKVPYAKAEELKKNISQSPQMDKILTVIEPTLRQLGAEVQRTIGFYKSKARGQRIHQCYLLGHTFRLPKMAEYLQAQVREAPFAIVEGLQRVKIDHTCNAEVWGNEFPTMAVAIGLGLQGLGLSELTLNLIPAEKKKGEQELKWRGWAVAAAAIVLATLGFSYTQSQKRLETFKEKLVELEKSEKAAVQYDKVEQQVTGSLSGDKQLMDRLVRLGRDRGKITNTLVRLANLKSENGAPIFGPASKNYLTALYVSRMPLGGAAGAAGGGGVGLDADRGKIPQETFAGPRSIYAPLARGVNPHILPPELRPDAPMVVVMTCEIESSGGFNTTQLLEAALKKLPEVRLTDTRDLHKVWRSESSLTETPLVYDWNGKAIEGRHEPQAIRDQPPSKGVETKYIVLHIVLRWDDPGDKDLEAVDAPQPAARGPGQNK